jgi:uncharacterized protein YbjT (DUF2867 family)
MYIVTGASSDTGAVIAKRLLEGGAHVRVVGRSRARLQTLIEMGAEAFVGDPTDAAAMREAFAGGEAAWVMLQPNYTADAPDFRGFQKAIVDAVVPAIADAGLHHVVSLSSWGADRAEGTGPALGLRYLEQGLNGIPDLNVLHLRPGYFMENLLPFAAPLAVQGVIGSPFSADVPVPFIANRDVSSVAADALRTLVFRGKAVRELQGERDLTFRDATGIIGRAVGRHELRYVQISRAQARREWVSDGVTQNAVDLMLEEVDGINSGVIRMTQLRDVRTSTVTSLETFAGDAFLRLYERATERVMWAREDARAAACGC